MTASHRNTAALNLFFGFYLSHNDIPLFPAGNENLHTIENRLRDSLLPITQRYADMDANCLIRFCNWLLPKAFSSKGRRKFDLFPDRPTTV